ncbi:hypothetical protein [Bradyrhizobium sp. SZCCHNR3003]|uniref:hypothetical protein n=1 Tax=Bradyrhizobium TaxID=374 RepID=UPI002916F58A|nr:hypothetical protein [Bradyrhizobium sp. SZCCHNR3003]
MKLGRSSQPYLTSLGILAMALGLLDPRPVGAADELQYFHDCVKQEMPSALRRFVIANGPANGPDRLKRAGDSARTDIVNDLFSVCRQRALDGAHRVDERSYVDDAVGSFFKEIPWIVDLQHRAEQLLKIDPDKAFEEQAVRAYSFCLEGAARQLARTSDDSIDAIEQEALAGCSKNRRIVVDTYSSHGKSYAPEAMTAAEQEFHGKVSAVVTTTRNDLRKTKQQ